MLHNSVSVQALLVCAALTGRGMGVQMTIPDHVSANGGRPVTLPLMRDIQPLAISTLSRADLIVYGRLVRLESYMNDAKTHVYTDYRIVPDRLIVDRSGSMGKVKRSGDAPSLVVVMNGGEIIVDGTSVKVDDLSQRRWAEDANLLMFLQRAEGENRYRLYGDSAGLFEVSSAGEISSLLKHAEKDKPLRGRTADEVIKAVLDASRR